MSELTSQERAGIVVFNLCLGYEFTTKDICEITDLTPRGARYLMARLVRVLPISYEGGKWVLLSTSS